MGPGTLGNQGRGWPFDRLPLAAARIRDSPDLRTDVAARPKAQERSATMPPSHKLGDVTSLLSVKVRPRLNKGLNHCLSEKVKPGKPGHFCYDLTLLPIIYPIPVAATPPGAVRSHPTYNMRTC